MSEQRDPGQSGNSRRWLLGAGAIAAVALVAGYFLISRPASEQAVTAEVSADSGELMEQGPLGDRVIGEADAPVTIVEYASMTCGHCAEFHNTVFPDLKKNYVDTGKVRFILREFPLDDLAAAAFMVARCAPEDRYYPMVGALFETQKSWAFGEDDPTPRLMQIAKQAGFSEEKFKACLEDQNLLKGIMDTRERAFAKFGVKSTPTFFINGKKLEGGHDLKSFEEAMAPFLKG